MRIGIFGFLLCWSVIAFAQGSVAPVRYISDEISVTLRKGEGMSAQVASLVKAGTRVELLEPTGESGYAKVKIAPGKEGWVLGKYLSAEPPARERIATMAAKLAEQQALVRKLSAQNERLSQSSLSMGSGDSPQEPAAAEEESAEKPVVDTLTAVGLVVVGILVGLIIPMLPGVRRRNRWSADL